MGKSERFSLVQQMCFFFSIRFLKKIENTILQLQHFGLFDSYKNLKSIIYMGTTKVAFRSCSEKIICMMIFSQAISEINY